MVIVAPGEAEPALAHLPLAALRLDDALLMDLRVLGMATVGDAADQPRAPLDPPPLKWSALKYGFWSLKEDGHGKTTQARRDRREAAAG